MSDTRSAIGDKRYALSDTQVRDQDIAFYQARVARDREGALDRATLGSLYLQRARETGSPEDLIRAEQTARESFGIRARKNIVALQVLSAALVGQHRYKEALEVVEMLVEDDPSEVAYRALKGEIEMELGMYLAAESSFASLRSWSYKLSVAPRLARWEELRGHREDARRILLAAREDALSQVNLPLEQKAWFHLRVGELALRYGRLGEAEAALKAGLEISPEDYRLLSAMSRLALERGHSEESIQFAEMAIAQVPDPAALGLLGDAYAAHGDTARAAELYRTMEWVVLSQPGAYHRAWSLFLLDHNRQVDQVLARVQAEIADRKDIYGYDLLAWALYKNGRMAEAREAMRQALVLGTKDPLLIAHNRLIMGLRIEG